MTVTFQPDLPGVFDATLRIDSNDPDEPVVTIALTGTGI